MRLVTNRQSLNVTCNLIMSQSVDDKKERYVPKLYGRFVTILFSTWTICHTFILDDLSQVIFVLDDMSKKERSGYGGDRSQLSFS